MILNIDKKQTPVFLSKIKTIEIYKDFVKSKKAKLPTNLKDKRALFVNWFLDKHSSYPLNDNINELSKNYLYISSRTIEDLLFKNEKTC